MALVTLQTIFQDALPAYEQRHALPAHVRRAAHALMQCRTAALGGHIQACPDGHVARVWYNSCRHRSCPQCAYLQTERWLARHRARLLACDHYHVIFTLPHDLNPLWLANVPVMTTLLLQAVRDTLRTLLAAPKYLGAQPGILAALHTWSQTLVLHPHLHCLVTGGGLTPTGTWVAVRNGFLLPARVVMAVFRGKMVAAIRQTFARGALALPEPMRPQQFVNLLNRLGHPTKTKWNVRIMERYPHGAGVVTYLARYLRGGPLKNARLVAYDGARVTFTYRARQEEADAGEGPRSLPYRAWASAGGDAGAADLADGVCPAWGGSSRAVSHLWAAARVHRRDPARGCATAGTGWGTRGMRPTRDTLLGEVGQGCGVSGGCPVVSLHRQGSGLGGSEGPGCGLLPRQGGGQGLWQAGGRRGAASQTP